MIIFPLPTGVFSPASNIFIPSARLCESLGRKGLHPAKAVNDGVTRYTYSQSEPIHVLDGFDVMPCAAKNGILTALDVIAVALLPAWIIYMH